MQYVILVLDINKVNVLPTSYVCVPIPQMSTGTRSSRRAAAAVATTADAPSQECRTCIDCDRLRNGSAQVIQNYVLLAKLTASNQALLIESEQLQEKLEQSDTGNGGGGGRGIGSQRGRSIAQNYQDGQLTQVTQKKLQNQLFATGPLVIATASC